MNGSTVHFNGLCSHILDNGVLGVQVNDIVFNLTMDRLPSVRPSATYVFHSTLENMLITDDENDTKPTTCSLDEQQS